MENNKYIGEFECRLDAKGRLMIPSALRKQLPDEINSLVVNRGFDKCLVLYTKKDWLAETDKLNTLNAFSIKDRQFIRLYNNGASELSIDGASRVLLPKKLMEYGGINPNNDVVLFAYQNKIEIWDKDTYEKQFNVSADELARMAEELLGNKNKSADNE